MTEAVEIETPDIEARFAKRIAPRPAIEAMRDRERRGKGRAVHIKYGPTRREVRALCWQKAQEQRCPLARPWDSEMLLARNKPSRGRIVWHKTPLVGCFALVSRS